jgi:hypothetical protein
MMMPTSRIAIGFLIVACVASAIMLLYSIVLLILAAGNTAKFVKRVNDSVDSLNLPAFQARADQFSAASLRANDLIARSQIAIDSLNRSYLFFKRIAMLVATVRSLGAGRRA